METISEGLQNYLEAILLCEEKNRVVRIKDLAERLGVKSPSAHAAIKELAKRKYVEHESYRHIELTPTGRKEAESIYSRHRILRRFFIRILGLPSEISDKTACGIEHHIDDITLKKIKNLFAFLEHKTNGCEKFAGELEEALKNE